MTTATLNVPAISCEHCERTVTQALTGIPGVRAVSVDVPGKQVRVTFNESTVSVDRMKQTLADEEYPVASVELR